MTNSVIQAYSRDIWSHGGGQNLRDMLNSSLATLILMGRLERPVYVSSPWISDFVLYDNRYREFEALFPDLGDRIGIRFSDCLKRLARQGQVRIITTRNETTGAFLEALEREPNGSALLYRFADGDYHEKGLLAPSFYIEGSMNFTYSGVYVRGEKVTYHCGGGHGGAKKIIGAYLEFERRWEVLK